MTKEQKCKTHVIAGAEAFVDAVLAAMSGAVKWTVVDQRRYELESFVRNLRQVQALRKKK